MTFEIVLIIAFVIIVCRLWMDERKFYENFDSENNLTQKEISNLKKLAKSMKIDGDLTLSNLRVKGNVTIDGTTHCKNNLTAREVNSVRINGNVVDGATVKGEKVVDNDHLLVKRGERIRITDGLGTYQMWTIEKD